VREAILQTTAELASTRGPFNVTMSEIAETVGVSRATLYKYFTGVEEILDSWHERHISNHLESLQTTAAGDESPIERLTAVLTQYAEIRRNQVRRAAPTHGLELSAFLHRPEGAARQARRRIHKLLATLITEATGHDRIRTDLDANELAHFCIHALDAAGDVRSRQSTKRLVEVVLAGLRTPQPQQPSTS
jgi:AcrR family transcriptional regulator